MSILSVKNLITSFYTRDGEAKAVDGISFEISKGRTMAIVGESGCGKSVTALSIMGLIDRPAGEVTGGEIIFRGQDLLQLSEHSMRSVRGDRISMIFQEPMTSLNPVMSIGEQIMEVTRLHKGYSWKEAKAKAVEMLDLVKIPDPGTIFYSYPHQLSGGMKQRIMIAIALSCEPDLLIADEPTTALDVTVQSQILKLIKDLQKENNTALLLITHDMGVVYEIADDITVMYAGQAVEQSGRARFFFNASHPYTTRLFESLPTFGKRGVELSAISGIVPDPAKYPAGCRFADRCHLVFDLCNKELPLMRSVEKDHLIACHLGEDAPSIKFQKRVTSRGVEGNEAPVQNNLFSAKGVKIYYPIKKGLFKRIAGYVKAVDGVDIDIKKGEILALVGESGCGKTTFGKGIIRLIDITAGEVFFDGESILKMTRKRLRESRKKFQIMFQDPYGSLNPRMMVRQIISEGMTGFVGKLNRKEKESSVKVLMKKVGLDLKMINRYPHEFSGGQRQRIGIARFLAVKPKFVVCDEVTSALDVSVQAQILNLLKALQQEEQLSYLFITHNLSVVSYLADRVAVMYLGRIVEHGKAVEIFSSPKHPYTKALLAASPVIGADGREKIFLEGDVPSPVNPPPGCHFHPRCPKVMDKCMKNYPGKISFSGNHYTSCFLYS